MSTPIQRQASSQSATRSAQAPVASQSPGLLARFVKAVKEVMGPTYVAQPQRVGRDQYQDKPNFSALASKSMSSMVTKGADSTQVDKSLDPQMIAFLNNMIQSTNK